MSFSDLSSHNLINLAIILPHLCPVIEIEKLLFSSVTLKKELVASKILTASNHFPSSRWLFGEETEKVSTCFFSLNSNVFSWFCFCLFDTFICMFFS